jgi:hypothetical protein
VASSDIFFHAFSVAGGDYAAEFVEAAKCYVARWQQRPLTVWLSPGAPQLATGGVAIVRDARVPAGCIYLEVPMELVGNSGTGLVPPPH